MSDTVITQLHGNRERIFRDGVCLSPVHSMVFEFDHGELVYLWPRRHGQFGGPRNFGGVNAWFEVEL
jgi:hypothetical protein